MALFNGDKITEFKDGRDGATGTPAKGSTFNNEFSRLYDNDNYLKGEIDKLGSASLSTSGTLGYSDTLIPTQKAVKSYADSIKPMHNIIINGDMNIWQRGLTFTLNNSYLYTADRFSAGAEGSGLEAAVTCDTAVPSVNFSSSLKYKTTSQKAALAAGDCATVSQVVEGYNIRQLAGKNITLSFYVKSSKPGTYSVSLRSGGMDMSCVISYSIDAADTWERKTVTLPVNFASGTWYYDSRKGLHITWTLCAGSSLQTAVQNQWQSGNYISAAGQVNLFDTNGASFYITGVTLNEGDYAIPYNMRSFGEELSLCQRYYEKSYNINTAPRTPESSGRVAFWSNTGTGGTQSGQVSFKVTKRVYPSISIYSDMAGTINRITQMNGTDNAANFSLDHNGLNGFQISWINTASCYGASFHYTADAEF